MQFAKLAAAEQLCSSLHSQKIIALRNLLKVCPEKSHILSCDTAVSNERYDFGSLSSQLMALLTQNYLFFHSKRGFTRSGDRVSCVRHQYITRNFVFWIPLLRTPLLQITHLQCKWEKLRENNILCPLEPPANGRAHRLASLMAPLATSMRALDSATRVQGRGKIRTPLQRALLATE